MKNKYNGSVIGKGTVTVVINGRPLSAKQSTNSNFAKILTELTKTAPNADTLLELLDTTTRITKAVGRSVASKTGKVTFVAGVLKYNGSPLNNYVTERLIALVEQNLPVTPILNFVEKLMQNPSKRAVEELYKFLEHKNMPLTPDGNFLAYKSVNKDGWSSSGNKETVVLQGKTDAAGRIHNAVGLTIEVARNSVDDNKDHGCAAGLHAGSFEYANSFVSNGLLFLVEIDPKDVVSVPLDCNCQKLRTSKYKVVEDVTNNRKANSAEVVTVSGGKTTAVKNNVEHSAGYDEGYGDGYEGWDSNAEDYDGDYKAGYEAGYAAGAARRK